MRRLARTEWRGTFGIVSATALAPALDFIGAVGPFAIFVWLAGVLLICTANLYSGVEIFLTVAAFPAVMILLAGTSSSSTCNASFDSTGMTQKEADAKAETLCNMHTHVGVAAVGVVLLIVGVVPLIGFLVWWRADRRRQRLRSA